MKAVFYHKPDSSYDDYTGERYHFPHIYLSRVEPIIGDWIVYYGPLLKQKGRYYTGIAKVRSIRADPNHENHYYADLIDYIDFDRAVEYKENGGFEKRLVLEDGTISNGMKVQAVRKLEEAEFAAIVAAGLSQEDEWPDRIDETDSEKVGDLETPSGFSDNPQAGFSNEPFERVIVESLTRRKWRDRKFQQNIRIAYDRTCAFTSLRLINGLGCPEVEAAHIRPVKNGGNDSIRNGIALSGTVHWMFDRGLLSLADDFTIMESRHLNHDVSHLLNANKKAKVPMDTRFQPHPHYLNWHRENVFKH
ncbi:HNH endonuclease [Ahrensia marina]|uniref:HNH endonuclease n=1 Tax=Ahrensia marina TaxID=1514904 RepID=A0A0M9GQB4_9HYPH|nr:HNH endonuclease [Ahrensia marina]KPB02939.1 HNH endonuclease [Ahrensia marina]